MTACRKIILLVTPGSEKRLNDFVEKCIRDRVNLVAVVGPDCARFEDIIDELVVGDATDKSRYILTSSHPDESLDDVVAFASSLTGEYAGATQVVEL